MGGIRKVCSSMSKSKRKIRKNTGLDSNIVTFSKLGKVNKKGSLEKYIFKEGVIKIVGLCRYTMVTNRRSPIFEEIAIDNRIF